MRKEKSESGIDKFFIFIGVIAFAFMVCLFSGIAWSYGSSLIYANPFRICENHGMVVSWEIDPHDDNQLLLVCSN